MRGPGLFTSAKRIYKQGDREAEQSHSPHTRPLSLSMGPAVIEANAEGDPQAREIVNGWKPRFQITLVVDCDEHAWQ